MCRTTEKTNMSSQEASEIPFVLKMWLRVARMVPTVKIGGLDFGFSIATVFVLVVMKWATMQLLVKVFGWPADDLKLVDKGASCLVPIFHSGNLVPGLWACLRSQKFSPSARFDVAPAWWQESAHLMLQFCTGYMVYDAVFSLLLPNNFVLQDDDVMFMGHHIVTALYMTSTRIVGAGHQSAMICMFLGEATNPFHNMFYFLQEAMKLDCCNGPLAQMTEYVNTFLFASSYAVIRAVGAPLVLMFYTCYDLLANGRKDIPLLLMILWCILIWGVALGSIPWIEECWTILKDKYFVGNNMTAEL